MHIYITLDVSCFVLFRIRTAMLVSNSVSTIFRCMSCSFGTRDQTAYAEHIKHCSSNASTSEALPVTSDGKKVQRKLVKTPNNRKGGHVCKECLLPTGSSRSLLLHLREVHGEDLKIFICKFCSSYAARCTNSVYKHARGKHPDGILKGRVYTELHKKCVTKEPFTDNEPSFDKHCISKVEATSFDQNESNIPDTELRHVKSSRSLGLQFLGKQLPDMGRGEYVCQLCSFSHVVSHYVVKHIWKDHSDKFGEELAEASTRQSTNDAGVTNILYKCDDCGYSTHTKLNFYNHCAHHQFEGPSKCLHCSYNALTGTAIILHTQKYHDHQHSDDFSARQSKSVSTNTPVPSKVAKRRGNSRYKKLYVKPNKKKRWFTCPYCTFKSRWSTSVCHHKVRIHAEVIKAQRNMSSAESMPMKKSLKKVDAGDAVEINSNCNRAEQQTPDSKNKTDATSTTLKQSVKTCDLCSAKFKTYRSWYMHQKIHADLRRYQCPHCGFRSNYVQNVQKHLNNRHKDKKTQVTRLSLEDAKQTIEAYRKQCAELSNRPLKYVHSSTLVRQKYWQTHKQCRSDLSCFQCPLCGLRSNYKGNIKKHISSAHKDEKTQNIELSLDDAKQTSEAHRKQPENSSSRLEKLVHSSAIVRSNKSKGYSMSTPNTHSLVNSSEDGLAQVKQQRMDNSDASHSCLGTDLLSLQKRFVCSVCRRHSYHRSSIYRHIRNKHSNRKAKIIVVKGKTSVLKSELAFAFGRKAANSQKLNAETSGKCSTLYNKDGENKCQQTGDNREHDESSGTEVGMQNTVKSEMHDMSGNNDDCMHTEDTGVNDCAQAQPFLTKHKVLKRYTYMCDICPYQVNSLNSLAAHRKLHVKRSGYTFACSICPYFVSQASHLERHKQLHAEQSNANIPDGLPVKNVLTTDKDITDEMTRNKSVSDRDESTNTANDETVVDLTDENADVSVHSTSAAAGRHVRSWCCERCPYSTSNLACFKRHVWLHGKLYPYECCYCDYGVLSYWQLVSHVLWHFAPNRHLVYAQSVSNLDSFLSQLPNHDSIPESLAYIDSFIPSFENSDVFLLSDAANFQCDHCPFVTEQRSEFFTHMLCHCVRTAAYHCPYCNFRTDLRERLSAHISLHFNQPGCRQSFQPPNICQSEEWKQLSAAIESVAERSACSTDNCNNWSYGPVKSADTVVTENQATRPSDCEDDTSLTKSLTVVHDEDDNTCASTAAPQSVLSDARSVSADNKQHASITEPLSADNVTNFCRYCDKFIHDRDALVKHEADHLTDFVQPVL